MYDARNYLHTRTHLHTHIIHIHTHTHTHAHIRFVSSLAHLMMDACNNGTICTATSIVATVCLTTVNRGIHIKVCVCVCVYVCVYVCVCMCVCVLW